MIRNYAVQYEMYINCLEFLNNKTIFNTVFKLIAARQNIILVLKQNLQVLFEPTYIYYISCIDVTNLLIKLYKHLMLHNVIKVVYPLHFTF